MISEINNTINLRQLPAMPPLMIFGTNLQREELRAAMRIDANQKEHKPVLDCHYQLASCARKASRGSHFELCKLSIFSLFPSKWNRLKSFDNVEGLATRDTDIVSVIWLIGNQLIISGYVVNHSTVATLRTIDFLIAHKNNKHKVSHDEFFTYENCF